jgi:hypothetical protein
MCMYAASRAFTLDSSSGMERWVSCLGLGAGFKQWGSRFGVVAFVVVVVVVALLLREV